MYFSTFLDFTEIGDLGIANRKGFISVLNGQQGQQRHTAFPTLDFLWFLLGVPLFIGFQQCCSEDQLLGFLLLCSDWGHTEIWDLDRKCKCLISVIEKERWTLFPPPFLCQKSYGVCTFNLCCCFFPPLYFQVHQIPQGDRQMRPPKPKRRKISR